MNGTTTLVTKGSDGLDIGRIVQSDGILKKIDIEQISVQETEESLESVVADHGSMMQATFVQDTK